MNIYAKNLNTYRQTEPKNESMYVYTNMCIYVYLSNRKNVKMN